MAHFFLENQSYSNIIYSFTIERVEETAANRRNENHFDTDYGLCIFCVFFFERRITYYFDFHSERKTFNLLFWHKGVGFYSHVGESNLSNFIFLFTGIFCRYLSFIFVWFEWAALFYFLFLCLLCFTLVFHRSDRTSKVKKG